MYKKLSIPQKVVLKNIISPNYFDFLRPRPRPTVSEMGNHTYVPGTSYPASTKVSGKKNLRHLAMTEIQMKILLYEVGIGFIS